MHRQLLHKVVLIGDSKGGKTSIMSRLLNDYFTEKCISTVGTGCGVWQTSNGLDVIQLQIWDTAGQEEYKSLGTIFYRNAEAGILVLSLEDTFHQEEAEAWIDRFREVTGKQSLIVVTGSKCDISQTDFTKINRWAAQKGFMCLQTSAKTGENVLKMFKLIAFELEGKHSNDPKNNHAIECKPKCETCC